MQYRYKSKGRGYIILMAVGIAMLLGVIYLFHWLDGMGAEMGITQKRDLNDLIIDIRLIFSTLFLVYLGYIGLRFYRRLANDIIILDDKGITDQKSPREKVVIPWDEVELVNYGPKFREDLDVDIYKIYKEFPTTCLVILAGERYITIAKGIDKFPEIIRTIKSRVGDRFNTCDIPVEWKYEQIKNGGIK